MRQVVIAAMGVAAAVLLGGCLGSETSTCGDVLCPPETVCASEFGSCFAADAVAGCKGQATGSTCATATFEDGVCERGVCFAASCGDGVVNGNEICDDGAHDNGDGCSADCMSDESCGNGITDDAVGEECDCGDGTGAITAGCVGANSETAGATCRTSCIAHCGDGELNSSEQCEPDLLLADTCVDLGFDLGAMGCGQLCQLDFESCDLTGWYARDFLDDSLGSTSLRVLSPTLAYVGDGRRILKFDGNTWSENYLAKDPVVSIWALAENDVWATTASCTGGGMLLQCNMKVYHDDGTGWLLSEMRVGETSGAIWASGPNDAYVAGTFQVRHWDGSSWSDEFGAGSDMFKGIWGSPGGGDVWLVGNDGLVFRKTGGTWDFSAGPVTNENFASVWGSGNEVWVGSSSAVHHWDGSQWEQYSLPSTAKTIRSLWAGDDGLFAADSSSVYQFSEGNWLTMDAECSGSLGGVDSAWMACGGAILEYKGHGWGSFPEQISNSFDAQSRSSIYVIRKSTDPDIRGLYHFDGVAWSKVTVERGNPELLATTSDKVYVAGRSQWIVVLSSSPEAILRSGEVAKPKGLWASETGLVVVPEVVSGVFNTPDDKRISWKVGSAGWQTKSFTSAGIEWTAVHGQGDAALVIGNDQGKGIIVRYNGTTWNTEKTLESPLADVWVHDQNNAVAVGTSGLLLFYELGEWTEQELPTAKNLRSVSGTSMSDIFVTTQFDEIWHYDGATWTEVRGLANQRLEVQALQDTVIFSTDLGFDAWIR